MAIRSGSGGFVTITAGATDALADPFALPAWSATDTYVRDDQVSIASTDGTDVKYYVALDDHSAAAGDRTGNSATEAGVLDAEHWREVEQGQLHELVDWTLTRPVEATEGATLLIETSPRTSQNAGAVTLALNLLSNFRGSPLQRVLSVVNTRVYVVLYPTGKRTGDEQIAGYMRVGENSFTGNQTDDLAKAVTLTADGDFLSTAQT